MSDKSYEHLIIKDYKFWKLQIFENQGYLGRCVVWCKRENADEYTDMTSDEQNELLTICREWKSATTKLFGASWHNYSFLGNEAPHLHGHLVPRYSSPRKFAGIEFTDVLWGKRYETDKNFSADIETLKLIQNALIEELVS